MQQGYSRMQELVLAFALTTLVIVGFLTLSRLGVPFFMNADSSPSVGVYVSVPMQLSTGKEIVNGVTLAFEERGYAAGTADVQLLLNDDGDETGSWTALKEDGIARSAAANPKVVAYLGTFNSGAAKISMPILNEAGIVQVSPGNTWPGLTKPGFLPGEPGIFYPTGVRHYFRVSPTDDLQGPAGALWAKNLGFKTVFIIDDNDVYGKGIADLFQDSAKALGLSVLGHMHLDPIAENQQQLIDAAVTEALALRPDVIYYGGTTPNGGPEFLAKLRTASSTAAFMGPDGILEQDFIDRAGREHAEGVYATTVGAPPLAVGTPRAKAFSEAYMKRFGSEAGVFGAFGYEAAEIILDAIQRSGEKTRAGVLQEVRATKNIAGLFGPRAFDQNGDTTLTLLSGNIVQEGRFHFVSKLLVP